MSPGTATLLVLNVLELVALAVLLLVAFSATRRARRDAEHERDLATFHEREYRSLLATAEQDTAKAVHRLARRWRDALWPTSAEYPAHPADPCDPDVLAAHTAALAHDAERARSALREAQRTQDAATTETVTRFCRTVINGIWPRNHPTAPAPGSPATAATVIEAGQRLLYAHERLQRRFELARLAYDDLLAEHEGHPPQTELTPFPTPFPTEETTPA